MRFTLRAAGLAAASFTALVGAVYAGPSRALEMNTAPLAAPYTVHASAAVDGGDLSLNGLETERSEAIGAPIPIADHARATVPAPVEPEREADDSGPRALGDLVGDHASSTTRDSEHECLAGAVYFESKGEPLQGQLTVAEVVLNRARSGRFPASVCGVVKQRGQFSFIRGRRFPPIARGSAAWHKAVAVAHIAMEDLADGAAPKALFFHARRVSPGWRGLTRVAAVGNHIFYR
jgi:N-acetylmuramoyl-L-alanine amidase